MFLPKAPCKDCPDRNPSCHTTCDKYKQYKVEHKKKSEELANLKKYFNYKAESISDRNAQLSLRRKRKGG